MAGTVAVTGVTGDVGGKTLELLRAQGVPVRGIVRRPEQAEALAARGVEARVADLGDGAATARALEGVDQLFLVTAATPRQEEHGTTAVRAAREAGVRALVQLSGGDAAEHSPMPWASAIWRVDEAVRASGLARTILHPSGFMTNLEPSGPAIRRGALPADDGPWGHRVDRHRRHRPGGGDCAAGGGAPRRRAGAHRSRAARRAGRRPRAVRGARAPGAVRAPAEPGVRRGPARDRDVRLAGEGLRQQFGRVARHGLDGGRRAHGRGGWITGTPARPLSAWARERRAVLLGEE